MEGYNPFSALNQVKSHHFILTWGGSSRFIIILHGGGLPKLLQYYNGGGVSRDPEFVLRNIWTTPYYYFSGQDQVYMN